MLFSCLRIVENEGLPDDVSYSIMSLDTERTLATTEKMVTIAINHMATRAADGVGRRGKKFDAKPESNSNHKLLWEHSEAEVWVRDCPQP